MTNLGRHAQRCGYYFLVMFSSNNRLFRKEKRWLTKVDHNSWWHIQCVQHAASEWVINRSGWHLHYVRTSIWVALAVLHTPYVDRVYRENLEMDWHVSLSSANLTVKCHPQFEMDRINICDIFLNQHGLPVSKQTNRQSSHQSGVLFFILRENAHSWQQD